VGIFTVGSRSPARSGRLGSDRRRILSDCGSRSTYKSELIGRPRGWLSV